MSEQQKIDQTVRETGYAATSGTGTATINIHNYYYRSEKREMISTGIETVSSRQLLRCPYRGLLHFGPDDAEFFFGRNVFVEALFQATQVRNFIPVIGGSGSGKSSVVLAGLVPKLKELGSWEFTHFRPSFDRKQGRQSIPDPFYALSKALVPLYEPQLDQTQQLAQASDLADYLREGKIFLSDVIAQIQSNNGAHQILLIVDQFEELYTTNLEENVRHHFLDILIDNLDVSVTQSPPALVLVLTLRTDFLEKALAYRPFADLWQNADIKLSPMQREELAQVIEKPAQRLGVKFEAGLVERILEEVENEPGNLPLLEFALSLLWEQRNNQGLTHKGYEAIGRVRGALAKYADREYDKLSDSAREQARHIFIQLVHPGEGAEDARRLATKEELGEPNWSLVKKLADSRLLVTSRNDFEEDTVEVVHEALIQNWDQFQEWMNEDRRFRIWQERLRVMLRQWKTQAEDEGGLLRGALLLEAEAWLNQRSLDLSATERDFIEKSLEQRDRAVQAEAIRRQKELRLTRRVAIAAGMAALFAGSALLVGGFAFRQAQDYQRSLEAVFLDSHSQAILEAALPQFWQEAYQLQERDPKRALGYYRQILRISNQLTEEASPNSIVVEECSESYPEDLPTLSSTAEHCLSKLLEIKISNTLEPQLDAEEFGGTISPEIPVSEGSKRFPSGALKTTYEILMTQAGAGADLNGDGRLRTPSEAQQMPCQTLKQIEQLWREATQERCGWYGNEANGEYFEYEASECGGNSDRLLRGKTLTLLIFDTPADFAIKRLNTCDIRQPEAINA